MKIAKSSLLILVLLLNSLLINAQDSRSVIDNYLTANKDKLSLSESDITDWRMSSEYVSKHNNVTHAHIQQTYNGIDVFNAMCNFAIDANYKVVFTANNLISNTNQKVNATATSLDEVTAIQKAMTFLSLFDVAISKTETNVVYFPLSNEEIRLSYHIVLHTNDRQHVWNVMVDASNENVHKHWDQVIHCTFGHGGFENGESHTHIADRHDHDNNASDERRAGAYNVFAIPVESPIHGAQSLVSDPEFLTASPFGWHDTNGSAGAEYTITKGNNVYAYEDQDNNDQPGYSPDGGVGLTFDYPYVEGGTPAQNEDAAITNVFYMSNIIHDVLYAYGFDEESGNFQFNNYGNGGSGSDEVLAEAMDGAGLNNANFYTPSDGQNPAMQMFLWSGGGAQNYLYINTPAGIAGPYASTGANFGPDLPTTPLTADVVLYDDGIDPINDACEDPINGAALNGKIAILDRGDCNFTVKVKKAQVAGAVAVIVVNNVNGSPITMGGTDGTITIPSIMVNINDGTAIKDQVVNGGVNATLVDSSASGGLLDGDFDNGIIIHEYGHGISTRLVGGRFNSNCLNTDEQMGEGWSDWYGAMLTMDMNVANPVYRPIGTFVQRESPTTGFGIRPAPYDTSFTVNDYTYGDIDDVSVPHGVGFVWCTALWDLTWALIDKYGYDADLYNGTGGNNIAMQLVTDGLKMTACNPSFMDGRDAILMADEVNYGGANQCLIWEVFARRGMGYSASSGIGFILGDETEGYDTPPSCDTTLTAAFTADVLVSCDGEVQFNDASTGSPDVREWSFGDGNSSTEQNPSHTYREEGTYTVTLTVSSGNNEDETTETDYVTVVLLEAPGAVSDNTGCVGESLTLTAISDNTLHWYDSNDNLVETGDPFITPALTSSVTYFVADAKTVNGTTCVSEKLPLNISVAEADFSHEINGLNVAFTDESTRATTWSWEFGDGQNSTEQNPIHSYDEPGIYDVELSINNKQCEIVLSVEIVATGIKEEFLLAGVELTPNPAESRTILYSDLRFPANAIIQVISVDGKLMQQIELEGETNQVELDLKELSNGVYSVVVALEDDILTQKKLVVSKK